MLTRGALSQVLTDPSVAARLEAARVYEILTPGEQPLAAAGAEPVVTFSAVSALRQAVDGGQLPPGTGPSSTIPRSGRTRPWPSSAIPSGPRGRPRP